MRHCELGTVNKTHIFTVILFLHGFSEAAHIASITYAVENL